MLEQLAHWIVRRRRAVIAAWIILTIFGAYSAGQVSKRWFQSFSIPGYSAYEANQRTLKTFGSGEQVPLVVVLTKPSGDITRVAGAEKAVAAVENTVPGSRVGSWFTTHSDMYLSKDRHTMVATVYPPGTATFSSLPRSRRRAWR